MTDIVTCPAYDSLLMPGVLVLDLEAGVVGPWLSVEEDVHFLASAVGLREVFESMDIALVLSHPNHDASLSRHRVRDFLKERGHEVTTDKPAELRDAFMRLTTERDPTAAEREDFYMSNMLLATPDGNPRITPMTPDLIDTLPPIDLSVDPWRPLMDTLPEERRFDLDDSRDVGAALRFWWLEAAAFKNDEACATHEGLLWRWMNDTFDDADRLLLTQGLVGAVGADDAR